jgi:multidrug efflux pump subunit AcrB
MITMLCIAIIVLGIVGFVKSPLQEQPNITYPTITVNTDLPGANANTVNQTVTKPIEKTLNSISNLQTINSASSPGTSKIVLNFALGTNMSETYNQVENSLNHIRDILPQNVHPPLFL